ncbi:MAG TPA: copper chaperone PCu(A)C [Sphingomicrobium sp.]|nr:copper chaperone PCu(A)C [Sphingomicrobium sp.]
MKRGLALAAFVLLASCNGPGGPPAIALEDGWARATSAGQTSSAVYLTIANRGGEDRLVSVSSPLGEASIHSTTIEDGVMRMRPLETLEIPANFVVELEPHGTHIMVAGLDSPVEAGEMIPLTLDFERSGERQISARARPAHGAGM